MELIEDIQKHRPNGYLGKGDRFLPSIMEGVMRILEVENKLADDLLWLSDREIAKLAGLIVEFAEDIHNDIGLWASYERYNVQFYGTSLPLTVSKGKTLSTGQCNVYRIQHFLWNIYSELKQDILIPPACKELVLLSEEITDFIEKSFKNIPHDSGIRKFLSERNTYGWEVKKKLVWLGIHFYIFRIHFLNYLEEKDEDGTIPIIDDFVNQETTKWSGLGVIDILSDVLNISNQQKSDIKHWYERHASWYKVIDIKGKTIQVQNIVNDQIYTVMYGDQANPFKSNHFVVGNLIPYNKYWYWSGVQKTFGELSKEQVKEIKQDFIKKCSNIVYRYHDELAGKARKMIQKRYKDFVKFFGDDLLIFPDGLTMASELQKRDKEKFNEICPQKQSDIRQRYDSNKSFPSFSLPQDLLEDDTGLGVYCNPGEGEESMRNFNNITSGFKKKGLNLDQNEQEAIRVFVEADAISPLFVKRIIGEYGDESLAKSFLIPEGEDKYYIDYLLRRYKGHFYRNRYPSISFV